MKIKGPYKYGSKPPAHLMGWREDLAVKQKKGEDQIHSPPPSAPLRYPNPWTKIWDLIKASRNGSHLETFEQQVGDCVGAGLKQACDYLIYSQIARQYLEQYFRPCHASWIYGMSRVNYLLNSISSDGSTGRAGALVLKNNGMLYVDWDSCPPYSGKLSREWGQHPGPPKKLNDLAKPFLTLKVQELNSTTQIRDALLSGACCTIASSRGFEMSPRVQDGMHIWVPSGTWMHQMCLIEWIDDPFPAAYRLNSWGPNAHGTPLNGEPPGGAWNRATVLQQELNTRSVECFAFSLHTAWPTLENNNILYDPPLLCRSSPPAFKPVVGMVECPLMCYAIWCDYGAPPRQDWQSHIFGLSPQVQPWHWKGKAGSYGQYLEVEIEPEPSDPSKSLITMRAWWPDGIYEDLHWHNVEPVESEPYLTFDVWVVTIPSLDYRLVYATYIP